MPKKENWGHSMIKDAYELAKKSNVNHLLLFHHDPDRNRNEIQDIVAELNKIEEKPKVTASFEGLELDLLGK